MIRYLEVVKEKKSNTLRRLEILWKRNKISDLNVM
jgi:hypothetical protein